MLQIQKITYVIGEFQLLKSVEWIINPGRRVGLIGANGAGKTTLLRILNGDLEYDSGTILKPKDYTVGYLPQEVVEIHNEPILSSVLEGNRELTELEYQIFEIHRKLETQKHEEKQLLSQLGDLESRYAILGGYEMEDKAKKILTGLGFLPKDLHRPLAEFSGGWRMRVYLARLLLRNPDLLLLDEPTNHLDLESLEWLENYLRTFPGSMIVVSHDRFFIDRLAQEIAELENGRLTHYPGNYHFFEKRKALIREQTIKKWEEQKEERERLQRFIDRFRYKATKASQVQSRVKQLEKMEEIELPPERKRIHFKIQADVPSYKDVLRMNSISFRYEDEWVLRNLNLHIHRGEKIALVGVNGAGKTTLTRLISKELVPQEGTLETGERVRIGYYAQHQADSLHLDKTVYEEVESSAAPSFRTRLRDILGIFQFSGADTEKRIGILSGGEKARVSLAKILLSPCNFLIMDEPTNHLDLISKEALEEALADYDGTLLIIAHDRYFLDKLVHRVIELRNGHLYEYVGSYSEYLNRREEAFEAERGPAAHDAKPDKKEADGSGRKTKEQKRREAEARQAVSKERNRLQKEIGALEIRIDALERRKAEIETILARPETYSDPAQVADLNRELSGTADELHQLEENWTTSQEKLELLLEELESYGIS